MDWEKKKVINMIQSNFGEMVLLCNLPITIQSDQGFIILHIPTIKDEYSSIYDCNFFFGCCVKSLSELKEDLKVPTIKSKLELMKAIIFNEAEIAAGIIQCLNMIIQDFKYVDGSFYAGDTLIVDEVFDIICGYIAVAIGGKELADLEKDKELANMDEAERAWELRKRKNEEKIRKSKSKGGKTVTLSTILACVNYEFHIPLSELCEMNKFTVYFFYSKIGKISTYEVTKIAAGTGNLGKKSKHTYWTN